MSKRHLRVQSNDEKEQTFEPFTDDDDLIGQTIRKIKDHIRDVCNDYLKIIKQKPDVSFTACAALAGNSWGIPTGTLLTEEIKTSVDTIRNLRAVQGTEIDTKDIALALRHLVYEKDRKEVERFAEQLRSSASAT